MKVSELKAKKSEDLQQELLALLKEQFNLRMQRGLGEQSRPHQFKVVRRNIARIKTILREKAKENHE